MRGSTALITGSTHGIVWDIIGRFAQQGCNLVMSGPAKSTDVTKRMIQTLQDEHPSAEAVYLQSYCDSESLVEQTLDRFQSIDYLLINSIDRPPYRAAIEEFPIEKWREIIECELISRFALVKAIWPKMKRQHFGRIIQIVSLLITASLTSLIATHVFHLPEVLLRPRRCWKCHMNEWGYVEDAVSRQLVTYRHIQLSEDMHEKLAFPYQTVLLPATLSYCRWMKTVGLGVSTIPPAPLHIMRFLDWIWPCPSKVLRLASLRISSVQVRIKFCSLTRHLYWLIIDLGYRQTHLSEQFSHVRALPELIQFLCTAQARHITGQTIGWTLD